MNYKLTSNQIKFYQENGYLILEDFLTEDELKNWQKIIFSSVDKREGIKIPGSKIKTGEDDGINADAEYFGKVFDQIINLWQTDEKVKEIILDKRIGEMATLLSGTEGIRPWHDQALFKKPWANATAWHLDTPFWSFDHREALSIWVALDDATIENGCLHFIPGSHKGTNFDNIGIGKNMDDIFHYYPMFRNAKPIAAPIKAGSCTFHNGLTIHAAGPNMTNGLRRAMTCAFMPDGSTFNGKKNILSEEYFSTLKVGDLLNNEQQNPLIYKRS